MVLPTLYIVYFVLTKNSKCLSLQFRLEIVETFDSADKMALYSMVQQAVVRNEFNLVLKEDEKDVNFLFIILNTFLSI